MYDTVTSPDTGDGLNGVPYDEALKPFMSKVWGLQMAGRVYPLAPPWFPCLCSSEVLTASN